MKNLLTFILSVLSFTCFVSNVQAQVIEGKVYIDFNANGQLDTTEYGFGGIQIYLYEGCQTNSPILDSVRTDSVGAYQFNNLPLGIYSVKVNKSDPKSPTSSSSPSYCCLELITTAIIERCNFGYPPPNCTSNPFSVDNFCDMAYANPLCNLTVIGDFACGQNPSILGPWKDSLHCGGKFQNTSFYSFVAGTGNYNIEFTVFSCAGTGLQYGLMDSCNPSGPYYECNGNSNYATVSVDASSLIPGKTYIFWLDGYQGSVCPYYIQVTGDFNVFKVPDVEDISLKIKCDSSCTNYSNKYIEISSSDYQYDLSEISGVKFNWLISNESTTISMVTTQSKIDVSSLMLGIYTVCVDIEHPCWYYENTKKAFCKTIEIRADYSFSKGTFDVCNNDFPWNGIRYLNGPIKTDEFGNPWAWEFGPIKLIDVELGINTFVSNLIDSCGCPYQQIIELNYQKYNQPCDDNNPNTFEDKVRDDCVCRGIQISGVTDDERWFYTPHSLTFSEKIWKVLPVKDTIIELQQYKIIGIDKGDGLMPESYIPIARVNQKLFFNEGGEMKLFYDYGLKEGSTFEYNVPKVQRYYDISSNQGSTNFGSLKFSNRIRDVNIVLSSEGKMLKKYSNFQAIHNNLIHVMNDFTEYAGSDIGFFGAFSSVLSSGKEGYFRCYQSNEINYSVLNQDCLLSGIEDTNINTNFSIKPNPSADDFLIKSNFFETVDIIIFDMNGKVKTSFDQFVLNENQIDVSTWASGMYYVLVKTKNDVTALKFIKVE